MNDKQKALLEEWQGNNEFEEGISEIIAEAQRDNADMFGDEEVLVAS